MAMPMSEVTENLVLAGEGKTKRPQSQMVVLGVMAGALIAAGAMASSVAMHAISNAGLARLTAGLVFPIGFVLMALFGGELFTGDCLMVIGALKHRYRVIRMISVLCLVFVSNLLGGILFAGLVALSGQFGIGNGAVGAFTIKLALSKASLPFMSALVSGILCNFFVCIGVVMAGLSKEISGKILASYLPIFAFVVGGFEYCVANMYYIPAGIFAAKNPGFVEVAVTKYGIRADQLQALNWKNFFLTNELPVTIGNVIGGMLLIGAVLFFLYGKEVRPAEDMTGKEK